MPRHLPKLLVLLTLVAVAPASAGQLRATDSSHDSSCPYQERAKLAPEGYEVLPVTTAGDPADGSFFDAGRRAVFAP